MRREQPRPRNLAALTEVMQISPRVLLAGGAAAGGIERREVEFMLRFQEIEVLVLGDPDIVPR